MKKILIIEDDNLIIKILDFILKREGYETFISKDGNDGIDKIGQIQPDLIITDIMMPYKSGLEITAFSKKNCLLSGKNNSKRLRLVTCLSTST